MAEIPSPETYAAMSQDERRAALGTLTKEQQAQLFKSLTAKQLIAHGKAALQGMNTYEAILTKEERVRGKRLPSQTMKVQIRERPFAVRLEVIAGANKGRKVLYNEQLKPGEIRAKESGLLGFAGGVWVDMNGSLAKGDTEHVVTELGFSNLLKIIEKDELTAEKFGGQAREDEGFDTRGNYCMRFTAPKGGTGLYAQKSRLCFDPVLSLPVEVEVSDAQGFKEKFAFTDVKPKSFSDADFQPKAFGL